MGDGPGLAALEANVAACEALCDPLAQSNDRKPAAGVLYDARSSRIT